MPRPTVSPDFATDSNFTAPGKAWDGQPTKVSPGGIKTEGWEPQTPLAAQHINYMVGNHGEWINYLDGVAGGIFGYGAFGSAAFDGVSAVSGCSLAAGVYTATQDLFYTDATISAGVELKMAGYRLYVSGTLTMSSAAPIISCNGVAGSGGTAGGAPGNILSSTGAGGAGGASGGPNNGVAGSNIVNVLGNVGGAGGNGAGGGAAAGTIAAPSASAGQIYAPPSMWNGILFGVTGAAAVQGGSGGGGGGGGTGTGGGGGGGGGVLMIVARIINLSGTASLRARGGAGGNGAGGANAGGGGGGGGGAVVVAYRGLTTGSSSVSSCVSVTAGTGGTATGGGAAGSNGSLGNSYIFAV